LCTGLTLPEPDLNNKFPSLSLSKSKNPHNFSKTVSDTARKQVWIIETTEILTSCQDEKSELRAMQWCVRAFWQVVGCCCVVVYGPGARASFQPMAAPRKDEAEDIEGDGASGINSKGL
jgi:hypothetical protein